MNKTYSFLILLFLSSLFASSQALYVNDVNGDLNIESITDIKKIIFFNQDMRVILNSGDTISKPLEDLRNYRYDQNSLSLPGVTSFNNDLKVYPNPTKHSITFSFIPQSSTPYYYRLVDILGKVILSEDLGVLNSPFSSTLNIQNVPSGLYFLELRNATEKISKKIIKL